MERERDRESVCVFLCVCVSAAERRCWTRALAGHIKKETRCQEDLRTMKTWTRWFDTAELRSSASYQDGRVFSSIYWMIYWDGERKKKNPFSSLFISVLNNNGMNNHKLIKKLEVQWKEGQLRPQLGSLNHSAPAIPSPQPRRRSRRSAAGHLETGMSLNWNLCRGSLTWAACGFSVFTENWSSWKEGWCSSRLPPAFEARHRNHTFISLLAGPSGARVLSFSSSPLPGRDWKDSPVSKWHSHKVKVVHVLFFLFIFKGRIIPLQCCVGFCRTSAWISRRYTYALPLEPPSHRIPPL